MTKTLVLGVGDVLRADEGAGIHAMRYLKDHYDLPDTAYIDTDKLGSALADDIAAAENLIVFNVAQIGADPGSIRVLEDDEAGLAKVMNRVGLGDNRPAHYALISIQPGRLGVGGPLSERVRRSLPKAAGNAATLVYRWRRSKSVLSTGLRSLPNSV